MKNPEVDLTSRRSFVKTLGAWGLVTLPYLSLGQAFERPRQGFVPAYGPNAQKRISYLAHRETNIEGQWSHSHIEGQIPANLKGTLFRNGPGSKSVGARPLNHFFDGDAYITAFQFSEEKLSIRSQFVNTVERQQEQNARKMLYHDFGTTAPQWPSRGFKNPPNINITAFDGMLLALSEASHPTALDLESLQTKYSYSFGGSLPGNLGFTAHPKTDPTTQDLYAFGVTRAMFPELKIYRVNYHDKKNSEIHSFNLGGFFPIHDCLMTENHIVFVVSPMQVNMLKAATLMYPVADILEYDANKALRILIFSKHSREAPIVIESQPSALVFHHINAYEEAGKIIFDTILIDDASPYQIFKAWAQEQVPKAPKTWITRFEVNLKTKTMMSRKKLSDGRGIEFPCIDLRRLGQKLKYFYVLESDMDTSDPLSFSMLSSWDSKNSKPIGRAFADAGQSFGEAVCAPKLQSSSEEENWILHLGYDSKRDESFLDIRKSVSLELEARVWLGRHLPLGFHGIFVS